MTMLVQDPDRCPTCFTNLIYNYEDGEKICPSKQCNGIVIEDCLVEQNQVFHDDKNGNKITNYSQTSSSELSKKDLQQLGLGRLVNQHTSKDTLKHMINKIQKAAERHLSCRDRKKKEAVFLMIEKITTREHEELNNIAKEALTLVNMKYKPIMIGITKQRDIIKRSFTILKIPYSMKRRKQKKSITNDMSDSEKKYWIEQNKDKRGRKEGHKIGAYSKWEFYGDCKRCGNPLQDTIADHQKRYHPEHTEQAVRNWFKRRLCDSISDFVKQCPVCERPGKLYKRKRGTYIFNHIGTSFPKQHTVPMEIIDPILEKIRRTLKKKKELAKTENKNELVAF